MAVQSKWTITIAVMNFADELSSSGSSGLPVFVQVKANYSPFIESQTHRLSYSCVY